MALAIVLKSKWNEPLIKSELIIVLLQVAFAIVLLIFSYLFFSYLYESILKTIIYGITESVASGTFNNGENLTNSLQVIKVKNLVLFSTISIALIAIFTFLIARMTLGPARTALASQKRFISDIAHELRTPLSIIKTNNEVALMDDDLEPKVRNMVKDNIVELDRMSEIINNVLSFSSILRPERIQFTNIDLGALVDTVVRKMRDLSRKKNLDITIKKVTPNIVWGNAVALEQVVTNILKNAINYTPQDGQITIRVGPDYYGNVLLHLEDNGIGITKKDLMHIFEPFYRAERSRNRSTGSSGLGLTIARELVKMHSGRIVIKSAKNKGTVVTVTLPYSKKVDMDENVDHSGLSEVSLNFLNDKN